MILDKCRQLFNRSKARLDSRALVRNIFFCVLVLYLALPIISAVLGVDLAVYFSTFALFGSNYKLDIPFDILGIFVVFGVGAVMVILDRDRCREITVSADDPQSEGNCPNTMPRRAILYFSRNVHFLLLSLVLIGAFLYYHYGISEVDFTNDEFQVIDTAYGYLQTGHFKKWDFCTDKLSGRDYWRAFPHTWLVSRAISLLGMSEWSARIVSVLFGVLSVLIAYFAANFFFRNRMLSIFLAVSLVLHSEMAVLFRITRMYSMLIPLFLVLFYCTHRLILQLNAHGFTAFKQKRVLVLLTAVVVSAGLNAVIHINSLVIFPSTFFLIVLLSLVTKQPVFRWFALSAIGMGIVLIVVLLKLDVLKIFTNHMSLFGSSNMPYFYDLVQFPLSISVSAGIALMSLLIAWFSKKKSIQINVLSLFSVTGIGGLFFVYVADRYYAFKYISFLIPIAMIWIFYSFQLTAKLSRVRSKQFVLYALLLANAALSLFGIRLPSGGTDFKTVYATIENNYNADKQELIAGMFLRCYYLREIGKKAKLYSLKKNRLTEFGEFMEVIAKTPSGWLTWETKKHNHVDSKIIETAESCFKKHHGTGKDDTHIELYYYDQDMSCIRKRRKLPEGVTVLVNNGEVLRNATTDAKTAPSKNSRVKPSKLTIDLSSAFTVSFWVKSNVKTPGAPVSFGSNYSDYIKVESRADIEEGGFRFRYGAVGNCSSVSTGRVNDGKWHWIALYQTGGKPGDEIGVIVDGKPTAACESKSEKHKKSTFLINHFNGELQDIRIYDTALSEAQMSIIYNHHTVTLASQLDVQGELFIPKYHLVF